MSLSPEKIAKLAHFTVQRASDVILWLAENGSIVHVNEAACSRYGYTYEELTRLNIYDLNPEFDAKRLAEAFVMLRADGVFLAESSHYGKDGTEFPVEIATNYIEFDGKAYTCSLVRDIRDRKRKEAALRGAFEEIRELKEKLEAENNYLKEELKLNYAFGEIISQSPVFAKVLKQVEQVATTDSTVLISGESGTGKELVARAVHRLSRRKRRSMIKVNCAALPTNLIESELFGHEKGAFTGAVAKKQGRFELADEGTLFLDEIGELPLDVQSKLLRVLQEGEFEPVGSAKTLKVDVRIIAATNRNLQKEVEKGEFREDLYYRLNVFPISCPPLRDRKEDIPLLVRHFCDKLENRIGKTITHIPVKTLNKLDAYNFPGNIRELENIIERAIIVSKGGKLQIGDWLTSKRKALPQEEVLTLDDLQKQHIIKVLKLTQWRVSGESGAAKVLGIRPTTLESRMKKLGISRSMEVKTS